MILHLSKKCRSMEPNNFYMLVVLDHGFPMFHKAADMVASSVQTTRLGEAVTCLRQPKTLQKT